VNVWKLDSSPRPITGFLSSSGGRGPVLSVRAASFDGAGEAEEDESLDGEVPIAGSLVVLNTVEEFKGLDKNALLARSAESQWSAWQELSARGDAAPAAALSRFQLIVWADIKDHKFLYWFCFPAVVRLSAHADALPRAPAVAHDVVQIGIGAQAAFCSVSDAAGAVDTGGSGRHDAGRRLSQHQHTSAASYAAFLRSCAAVSRQPSDESPAGTGRSAAAAASSVLSLISVAVGSRDATAASHGSDASRHPRVVSLQQWADEMKRAPPGARSTRLQESLFVLPDGVPAAAAPATAAGAGSAGSAGDAGSVPAGWFVRNMVCTVASAVQHALAPAAGAAAFGHTPISVCLLRPARGAVRSALRHGSSSPAAGPAAGLPSPAEAAAALEGAFRGDGSVLLSLDVDLSAGTPWCPGPLRRAPGSASALAPYAAAAGLGAVSSMTASYVAAPPLPLATGALPTTPDAAGASLPPLPLSPTAATLGADAEEMSGFGGAAPTADAAADHFRRGALSAVPAPAASPTAAATGAGAAAGGSTTMGPVGAAEAVATSAGALPPCPRDVTCIGWELNARGDPAPRLANLRAAMDPAELSEAAAQLNLHLMRWRMLPQLQLERIGGLRCLLLGAGTLGCHVARDLLAWGVRHFTFVDCGRVAYSNPVRQPLFEFADASAEGGGRWKAQAAAEALKRIHPRVHTAWHTFRVPMPGHPLAAPEVEPARRDVAQLEALVASHDVTFLLTDTRESRWLPTVLAASQGRLAVTVALGFDTFLAMRHGMRPSAGEPATHVGPAAAAADAGSGAASAVTSAVKHAPPSASATGSGSAPPHEQDPRLGCYFCMDVVSPTDSTQNRTLDQQCTVTRPGVAPLSAALAVELVMALLHHPQGFNAAADGPTLLTASTVSPLGVVPHQIRGFLTHMHPLLATVPAFEHCPACGDAVVAAYRQKGFPFLLDVFCDTDTCGAGEPLAASTTSGTTAAGGGAGSAAGVAAGAAAGSVGILDRITGLHDLQMRAEAAMRRAEEEAARVRGNGAGGSGRGAAKTSGARGSGPADAFGEGEEEGEEDELDDWILGSE